MQVTVTSSCAGLSLQQTNTSGIILSTTVNSGQYLNNMDCRWNLVSNTKVEVTFHIFSTQLDADYLYVYDGDSSSSPLIGNFSGTSLPAPITSSSNKLHLRFTTDSSVTALGFAAGYRGRVHLVLKAISIREWYLMIFFILIRTSFIIICGMCAQWPIGWYTNWTRTFRAYLSGVTVSSSWGRNCWHSASLPPGV